MTSILDYLKTMLSNKPKIHKLAIHNEYDVYHVLLMFLFQLWDLACTLEIINWVSQLII